MMRFNMRFLYIFGLAIFCTASTILGANSYSINDSLVVTTDSLDTVINEPIEKQIIDSLNTIISRQEKLITFKEQQIDSLVALSKSNEARIIQLTKDREFVDTCMARLANRWLYEKYNEKDVNEAISYFDKILSNDLRREHSVILELLKNYKRAYMDFLSVIQAAQRDPDRENPFGATDYKTRYLNKIESMSYYKRYYKESWNIRYLNERIKIAEDRLKAHTDSKYSDFSDLILELSDN